MHLYIVILCMYIITSLHALYKMQVLLHVSDYATIAIYSVSALLVAILALILPIETKGRSLTVSARSIIHVHVYSYCITGRANGPEVVNKVCYKVGYCSSAASSATYRVGKLAV